MTEDGTGPREGSRGPAGLTWAEWGLLLVLAAVQITHIVDFMILMPLGPRLMKDLHIERYRRQRAERFACSHEEYRREVYSKRRLSPGGREPSRG